MVGRRRRRRRSRPVQSTVCCPSCNRPRETRLELPEKPRSVHLGQAGSPEKPKDGVVVLPLKAELHIKGKSIQFPLKLELSLKTFNSSRLRRRRPSRSRARRPTASSTYSDCRARSFPRHTSRATRCPPTNTPSTSSTSPKATCACRSAEDARLDLAYGKVASGGRGLVFKVDEFALSRGGLRPRTPRSIPTSRSRSPASTCRSASTRAACRSSAARSRRSRSRAPANCRRRWSARRTPRSSISMGRGKDGSLIVQSAEAMLDKSNDPIVCHGTRFKLTLSAIGLRFHDFSSSRAGYHFYFTLTGSAEFKPRAGEFAERPAEELRRLTHHARQGAARRGSARAAARTSNSRSRSSRRSAINFFDLFTLRAARHRLPPGRAGSSAASPRCRSRGQVNFLEARRPGQPRKFDFHKLLDRAAEAGQRAAARALRRARRRRLARRRGVGRAPRSRSMASCRRSYKPGRPAGRRHRRTASSRPAR